MGMTSLNISTKSLIVVVLVWALVDLSLSSGTASTASVTPVSGQDDAYTWSAEVPIPPGNYTLIGTAKTVVGTVASASKPFTKSGPDAIAETSTTFDQSGFLTSRTEADTTTNFSWDVLGRLLTIESANQTYCPMAALTELVLQTCLRTNRWSKRPPAKVRQHSTQAASRLKGRTRATTFPQLGQP